MQLTFCPALFIDVNYKNVATYPAQWEIFLNTDAQDYLPWGHVLIQDFTTKPTKKQIRQVKREFRKEVERLKIREEFAQSWEGIHCDVAGL